MYQSKGVLGFGRKLSEAVSYALLVPQTSDVLLATTNWSAMEHSDQLSQEFDALMPTLRFVPLEAEGNPIAEGNPMPEHWKDESAAPRQGIQPDRP
ncbi:hypothetical protein ACSNOJ_28325 [Streptomyces sp. URMC 128]|uniref:hypothetical protein n=1 Tax=Streptomyces sp. URMC 128 TaxID=3423404 RepID=UPI003F1A1CC0